MQYKKQLKIVSVASEVEPFAKTGGLADVARSLPKALKRMGHDVIIVMPLYGKIIDKKKYELKELIHGLEVVADDKNTFRVNIWQGYIKKYMKEVVPIYFIEHEKYFSRYKHLYGSKHENKRFYLFDLAVLKFLITIKYDADIIQCHDWHTGLIPYLLKKDFNKSKTLSHTATVFTIHNLVFQFGHNWWETPERDDGYSLLPYFYDDEIETINFAKRAIIHADIINTVSENYAEEILTKDFGEDLHRILQNRKNKLFGIINGIDYKDYNPHTDPGLARNYSSNSFHRKKYNKEAVQNLFNLPINPNIPLLCLTSRIAEQKGFDLLLKIIEPILSMDLQMIIIGDGDKKYISQLKKIAKKYPKKFVYKPFKLYKHKETSLYAGGDLLLLPSRFEPCGLNPLIGMRYGCISVVHSIGGLVDTISNYNPKTQKGNGFVFKKYNEFHFFGAIIRALETYKYKDHWDNLVKKVMQQSFSWKIPAEKYVKLFRKAIKLQYTNHKSKNQKNK